MIDLKLSSDRRFRYYDCKKVRAKLAFEAKMANHFQEKDTFNILRLISIIILLQVPFSSDRKFMSVQERHNETGVSLQYTKGAIEEILPRCKQFYANGSSQPLDQKHAYMLEQAGKNIFQIYIRPFHLKCRNFYLR